MNHFLASCCRRRGKAMSQHHSLDGSVAPHGCDAGAVLAPPRRCPGASALSWRPLGASAMDSRAATDLSACCKHTLTCASAHRSGELTLADAQIVRDDRVHFNSSWTPVHGVGMDTCTPVSLSNLMQGLLDHQWLARLPAVRRQLLNGRHLLGRPRKFDTLGIETALFCPCCWAGAGAAL